jgi:hypothetical protein
MLSSMDSDDAQPVTEAQWIELSDAWRYAHLDRAPSADLRRTAIEEHERQAWALQATPTTGRLTASEVWARLPVLTRQAIVCSFVVAVVVIGAFLR